MRKILAFSFLLDFVLNGIIANCWVAVFTRDGFSLYHAALASATMCFAIALFELPTGYIADRYLGRKGSSQVGILTVTISMMALYAFDNFTIACLALGLIGFGSTFISGAKQAWLRNVAVDHYPERVKELFFDLDITGRLGTIAGIWGGAFLLERIGASSVWGLGAVATVLAILISLVIPSGSSDHKAMRVEISVFSESSFRLLRIPALFSLLFAAVFFGVEDGVRGVVFQPLITSLAGGNAMVLAYQASLTLIPRLLGSYFYKNYLIKSKNHGPYLALSVLAIAIVEAAISFTKQYWVFAVLWSCAVFAFGIFFPLRETVLHETIDQISAEKWRATLLSVDSLLGNIMQGITCLLLAASISMENLGSFMLLGSLALLCCSGCYWWTTILTKRRHLELQTWDSEASAS